jgi:predicted transcriptional regulator of viral defense system
MSKPTIAVDKAKALILAQGGIIRTRDAINFGIHPRTLYRLRDSGELEQLSRGLYRINEQKPPEYPDLITIARRVPKAVICLVSALSFHELTTQIPHAVSIALPKGTEQPRIDFPPITVYRFSSECYQIGIDTHMLDGVSVKIYNPEKTLADCFKFRNKLGMDIVLEALKLYRQRKQMNLHSLMQYATGCRVSSVMKPYLEVIM